ncbi:MAG: hypothetical protein ABIG84_05455 [archaeon]
MEILEALDKVHARKELDEKLNGKYLCSALTFLSGWDSKATWELNFYDMGTHMITQVTTDGEPHIKTEGEPFKPRGVEIAEINISDLKVPVSRALATGKEHYDDKYKGVEVQKLFVALHGGERPYWAISVITKHLTIVIIEIDTIDGSVIKSKVHTVFDKKRLAS